MQVLDHAEKGAPRVYIVQARHIQHISGTKKNADKSSGPHNQTL